MSFSRYSIEKKQVSTDRGVTWSDVDPSETRQGALVGVARTLLECEDMACDLEKTEYTVIDGALPDEICGDMISILPSGIASSVTWTSGAICCGMWQSASPYTIDRNGTRHGQNIGSARCIQDYNTTYCPTFEYTSSYIGGSEMTNFCFNVQSSYGWSCPATLCACFTINSFMPWAEGKTSWKLIQAQHYVRGHCSEAWVEDGEPTIVGIAERWKYVDETFERERWIHQIAKTFDENGNVVTWESEGNLVYRPMTEAMINPSIEILEYVINDGILKYNKGVSPYSNGSLTIGMALDENRTSFGGNVYTMWCQLQSQNDYGAIYNASTTDPPSIVSSDHWSTGWYHGRVGEITNSFKYFYLSGSPNTKTPTKFELFGLSGTKSAKLANLYGETIAFPCRIHENLGQEDDYWNSSQIGYVFRNGDGSMIAMEYILGYYTNTSGDTIQIKNNLNSLPSLPNAVSVSLSNMVNTIPNNHFIDNTALTSITMPNVATVGEKAFSGCTSLSSITFAQPNTILKDYAFANSGLRSVDLSNVSRLNKTGSSWGNVFSNCSNLSAVTIGNRLTEIAAGTFSGTPLTNVTIPSNVKTIKNNAFDSCPLTSVTLSEGIEVMSYSFNNCTSLTSVEIPSTVTNYTQAFSNCSNLEYVTIKTSAAIGRSAFKDCNLKELTMTVTTPPSFRGSDYGWDNVFTFNVDGVVLVPPSAVNAYINSGWQRVHPIPNETDWEYLGYACIDGQRYDYERKIGRNTEYSDEWFYLPEYRTVGEPYGECDGTEPY